MQRAFGRGMIPLFAAIGLKFNHIYGTIGKCSDLFLDPAWPPPEQGIARSEHAAQQACPAKPRRDSPRLH